MNRKQDILWEIAEINHTLNSLLKGYSVAPNVLVREEIARLRLRRAELELSLDVT
jgi:hypothetical protein